MNQSQIANWSLRSPKNMLKADQRYILFWYLLVTNYAVQRSKQSTEILRSKTHHTYSVYSIYSEGSMNGRVHKWDICVIETVLTASGILIACTDHLMTPMWVEHWTLQQWCPIGWVITVHTYILCIYDLLLFLPDQQRKQCHPSPLPKPLIHRPHPLCEYFWCTWRFWDPRHVVCDQRYCKACHLAESNAGPVYCVHITFSHMRTSSDPTPVRTKVYCLSSYLCLQMKQPDKGNTV